MPHYEIELPQGLTLLVGVHDHPVDFTIVFSNGRTVDFSFDAKATPTSRVMVVGDLHTEKEAPPLRPYPRSVVSLSSAGGPTIKYGDADSGGSRPMVP